MLLSNAGCKQAKEVCWARQRGFTGYFAMVAKQCPIVSRAGHCTPVQVRHHSNRREYPYAVSPQKQSFASVLWTLAPRYFCLWTLWEDHCT